MSGAAQPRRTFARLGTVFAFALLATSSPALAAAGPEVPCEPGLPAYPAFADPPIALNWHNSDLDPRWLPAPCVSWAAQPFTILTALTGRFAFAGSSEDLLLRFGAFSAWRGLLYWSATDKRYEPLVIDAGALSGPDARQRRPDFAPGELRAGADFFFLQQDNRSSEAVVYRMRVLSIDSEHLVINVENVTVVSVFIFTAFDPGDLRSTYLFTRLSPAIWGYYSLSGAREGAALLGSHGASYLNRAMAIYRHLAGLPGDQGPPAAP